MDDHKQWYAWNIKHIGNSKIIQGFKSIFGWLLWVQYLWPETVRWHALVQCWRKYTTPSIPFKIVDYISRHTSIVNFYSSIYVREWRSGTPDPDNVTRCYSICCMKYAHMLFNRGICTRITQVARCGNSRSWLVTQSLLLGTAETSA